MKQIGKIYKVKDPIFGALPVKKSAKLVDNTYEFMGDFAGITINNGKAYKVVAIRARLYSNNPGLNDTMNREVGGYFILELPTGLYAVRASAMGNNL